VTDFAAPIAAAGRPARRRRAAAASDWAMPAPGAWPQEPNRHHVIVIGAGIGGLTAGALLAKRGLKVLVVEAHNRPGGFCSCWSRPAPDGGSFRFDAGVQDFSGLGARGPLRHLLRSLDAEQGIEWRRVRHRYQRDGIGLDVPDDPADLVAALGRQFPDERQGIAAFFAEVASVYRELYADIEQTGGVPMAPATLEALLSWPAAHPHAWRWMQQPFGAMLDEYLRDPGLKALLCTIAEYVTDRPETLLVADMVPLFGYYFDGGAYPLGGSQRLADVLADSIAAERGQVLLRTRVKRILVEDGRVAGVVSASGRHHAAPVIIANGDVVSMLADLVGPPHVDQDYLDKLQAMPRGPSAILVSLGLDTVPDLPARIFVRQDGLDFGIGNPSVIDPSLAPSGCAAVTILCLLSEAAAATWQRKTPQYQGDKEDFADRLITATAAAVMPDLQRHILHCEVACPPTFTLFARVRNGNIYGAARNQWHPQIKSPVPGLLLVGAGVSTGPGIEAVVVSGTIAANLVTGS
jgi:all-trans-retinol 13,14-reductase